MKTKKLVREDFQYEPSYKYYSFKDPNIGIEIGIEGCFNGFDIAAYFLSDQSLIREKECTNELGYGSPEFITREIQGLREGEPQERRQETWDHALRIANKFYDSLKSHIKLQKMKILERKEGEEDPVYKPIITQKPIHGVNPRGRI